MYGYKWNFCRRRLQVGNNVDLWNAGCILAELLSGKPIMPGRTEVLLRAVEKVEDATPNRASSAPSRHSRRTLGSWSLTRKRRSPTTRSCRSSRAWSPSRSSS